MSDCSLISDLGDSLLVLSKQSLCFDFIDNVSKNYSDPFWCKCWVFTFVLQTPSLWASYYALIVTHQPLERDVPHLPVFVLFFWILSTYEIACCFLIHLLPFQRLLAIPVTRSLFNSISNQFQLNSWSVLGSWGSVMWCKDGANGWKKNPGRKKGWDGNPQEHTQSHENRCDQST